jgi:RNA polymerase sigma factor (sigma-70 family)
MASFPVKEYAQLSDEELVQACRAGEKHAWDTLVGRYERLVYTIPIRYGLVRDEADEVFQNTWLALVRHIDRLEQPDRLGAWLVTTARRECWERRRGPEFLTSATSQSEELLTNLVSRERPPDEVVDRYRRHRKVHDALAQLDVRCQKLLELLYFDADSPSYGDISEKMGMPVGSIGPIRARCLKKLSRLLEDLGQEDFPVS